MDGSGQTLPADALNDDFCDCEDGSDEPGTAACAGQDGARGKEVFFFCANAGAQPRYLYRSRVNDGICDCCDGSDEWRFSTCNDTCYEDGRAHREAESRRLEAWEKGTELQRRLVESSVSALTSWRSELEELKGALPELERESKERKKALAEAKAKLPPEPEAPAPGPAAPSPPPPSSPLPEETPEDRLRELQAMLDPGLKNERRALAALGRECKSRRADSFLYQLCFFREAFQTSKKQAGESSATSLGRWAGWDFSQDPPLARFEGGAECPGGQRRKLEVTFRCSSKAKLKSIAEPETCAYTAEVLHPGACDASRAPPEGAEDDKRDRWEKVLSTQKELLEAVDRELDSWRLEKKAIEEKLGASSEAQAGKEAAGGSEQPKISEYAKWMEGAGTDAPVASKTAPEAEATAARAEGLASSEQAPEKGEEPAESEERRAHREAEASWAKASAATRDTKHRIWGLEAKLHPGLSGGSLALSDLADKCLEKTLDKFLYKVCFFRHAHQDTDSEKGVSLGRWMGWDFGSGALPAARFGRGGACGNGVRRALKASFACGKEAAIESVTEKEACVYEAEVLHPGACDASERPEKRTLPAIMPHDEL